MATAQSLQVSRPVFGGWPLFGFIAFGLTLTMILVGAERATDIEAVRVIVRTTAQTSLALFLTAFSASSLHALMPNALTRWLLANRRYFGVSFAYSHFLHAIALYTFATIAPATFAPLADTSMFIFGGAAYAFIVLMTLTSFDATAALIGRRAWQILHTTGAHYIWLVFMISEGKRALHDTYYWPYVGALLAVMTLRVLAGAYSRARRTA